MVQNEVKVSYFDYIRYLVKRCAWMAAEYLAYGFFVALGGICAIKLFW